MSMTIQVWGVLEFKPTVNDFETVFQEAMNDRTQWASQKLDGVELELHSNIEEKVTKLDDREIDTDWVCRREIHPSSDKKSLRGLWGVPSPDDRVDPISVSEGIPSNLSLFGQEYYDTWKQSHPDHGEYYDVFGQTSVTCAELRDVEWSDKLEGEEQTHSFPSLEEDENPLNNDPTTLWELIHPDWNSILYELGLLSRKYGNENTRLSVWFEN